MPALPNPALWMPAVGAAIGLLISTLNHRKCLCIFVLKHGAELCKGCGSMLGLIILSSALLAPNRLFARLQTQPFGRALNAQWYGLPGLEKDARLLEVGCLIAPFNP